MLVEVANGRELVPVENQLAEGLLLCWADEPVEESHLPGLVLLNEPIELSEQVPFQGGRGPAPTPKSQKVRLAAVNRGRVLPRETAERGSWSYRSYR